WTKGVGFALLLLSILLTCACHRNVAAAPPPPPPPSAAPAVNAPAPTITLRAQPTAIDRGGSTTLQWQAQNATSVTIAPGVGEVSATGNRAVNPTSSVTYTATAMGPGGSATDTARITVNTPPAAPEGPAPPRNTTTNVSAEQLFNDNVMSIYFEY